MSGNNSPFKTLKRYLAPLLLLASFALLAASAQPQDRKALQNEALPIVRGDCPRPISLTLKATNPMSFAASDFNQAQLNTPHMTGLGDASINENFLYTFRWKKDKQCCQITKAILTVKMKANQPGSTTGSNSGNDGIAIMHQGAVVAPYSEAIYSGVNQQTAIKNWNLTGAALNNINQFGTLSFAVQDDTQVVSATLQLSGCCLGASTP